MPLPVPDQYRLNTTHGEGSAAPQVQSGWSGPELLGAAALAAAGLVLLAWWPLGWRKGIPLGRWLLLTLHLVASTATQIFLIFMNGYNYTWWNWIIAVPVSLFLGEIWPIYWLILRPIFGV